MEIEDTPSDSVPGSVYRILLQFAMLGVELGKADLALEIASVLKSLRPDLPHAGIVMGMSEFSSGQESRGVRTLEEVLVAFPDSQLAKAMLAVCLKAANRSGWQDLLESVIEDGRDKYALSLSCEILGRDNLSLSGDKNIEKPYRSSNAMWA